MKFLLVACFALVSVASGFPAVSQWSLNELSEAIQDPSTHPLVLPYLEQALNNMMTSLWNGEQQEFATVILPANVASAIGSPAVAAPVIVAPEAPVQESQKSPLVQIILNINDNQVSSAPVLEPTAPVVVPAAPVVSQWTLNELSEAMQNPSTDPLMMPYIEQALNELMANLFGGGQQTTATIVLPAEVAQAIANPVATPAVVQSEWTLHELSMAIQDPSTDAQLLPHLVQAMDELMAAIWQGQEVSTAIVTMPAPVAAVQLPALVDVPVSAVQLPALVDAPASSPFVQIIVNVNGAPVAPEIVGAMPVVPEIVSPVDVIDVMPVLPGVVAPEIVGVMPVFPVAPEIVGVMPVVPEVVAPEIVGVMPVLPEVVGVAPLPVNPIEVIAVEPPAFNPIDVIAIEGVETNPIDVLAPVPVVGGGAGIHV